jgi:hypothetical protein
LPLPLPPLAVNPGVVAAIREALSLVEQFYDSIPLTCPRS